MYIKLHKLFHQLSLVLPAFMYVYGVHVWSTERPEKVGEFLTTGVTDSIEI